MLLLKLYRLLLCSHFILSTQLRTELVHWSNNNLLNKFVHCSARSVSLKHYLNYEWIRLCFNSSCLPTIFTRSLFQARSFTLSNTNKKIESWIHFLTDLCISKNCKKQYHSTKKSTESDRNENHSESCLVPSQTSMVFLQKLLTAFNR